MPKEEGTGPPPGPQDDGQNDWEDDSPPGSKIGEVLDAHSSALGNTKEDDAADGG